MKRLTLGGIGLAAVAVGLASSTSAAAGFHDIGYASLQAATEVTSGVPPVGNDQSGGSALFISRFGDLFVSGIRSSGDGAGSASTPASADPTKAIFPEGTVIVEAAGSSDNFTASNSTSFAARDSEGGVWTWGSPYPAGAAGAGLIGRGPITLQQSYTPGQVTTTFDGTPLPPVVDLQRSENQFLALDADGNMYAWGYGGENMPTDNASSQGNPLPRLANDTANNLSSSGCASGANAAGTVKWHSIWGGNNSSGAVSQSGLIYTWGYDHSDGTGTSQNSQRCPYLNRGANQALFAAYPELYTDAGGASYDGTTASFTAIFANMSAGTLQQCAGVADKDMVDQGACPVRQLGFSARAPRMVLQNGDLYTWMISTDQTYGYNFLGRTSSTSSSAPDYRNRPAVALQNIDYASPGVGSVQALTRSGDVLGWGRNNFCQAIGVHSTAATSCSTNVSGDIVTMPTPVAGVPAGAISKVATTQCAAWAITPAGDMYAWGGGTIVGSSYVMCVAGSGYKIYDQTAVTVEHIFGQPVTANSTGTIRVK
ncbi:hypothetical protein ACFVWR_09425 [Leifsonia sp. NPDC058292]|uniref:hypothetical protein n=1 Tax=Leifsonia sp. NPDC058292 TaxID=3346428 RepID=UPI0036D9C6D2